MLPQADKRTTEEQIRGRMNFFIEWNLGYAKNNEKEDLGNQDILPITDSIVTTRTTK